MNKSELIAAISDKTGYTESSVREILNAFMEVTMHQVARNDVVQLVGFGTFSKRRRHGRNYHGFDSKVTTRKATTIPYFKAGEIFKRITRRGK